MATLGDSTITNLNVLNNITGKGSGITNLNASNLTSGSIGNITYEGKITAVFDSDHNIGGILVSDGSNNGKIVRLTNENDNLKSAFRTYIGAGTSSLALGSSASNAAAGNHGHGIITNDGKVTSGNDITTGISRLVVTSSSDNAIKTAEVSKVIPTVTVSSSDGVSITPAGGGTATTYKYTHPSAETTAPGVYKIGRDSQGHVVIGSAITADDIGSSIEIVDLTTLA